MIIFTKHCAICWRKKINTLNIVEISTAVLKFKKISHWTVALATILTRKRRFLRL